MFPEPPICLGAGTSQLFSLIILTSLELCSNPSTTHDAADLLRDESYTDLWV